MNHDVSLGVRNRYIGHFERIRRRHRDWPLFLSEGDSWFSFPLHSNTIDLVQTMGRIALLRLERNGDTLQTIMSGKQRRKLRKFLNRYPIDGLLFSAGGNDVVGEDFSHLLRDWREGMTWEAAIHREHTGRKFRHIRNSLLDLIDIRDEGENPDCLIFVHGYDYAIPNGRRPGIGPFRAGPWLKPAFDEREVPKRHRRDIVKWFIRRFNEQLENLADSGRGLVHLNTRGTITDRQWNDEIHPTRPGFRRIAEVFRGSLRERFEGVFLARGFLPEELWD